MLWKQHTPTFLPSPHPTANHPTTNHPTRYVTTVVNPQTLHFLWPCTHLFVVSSYKTSRNNDESLMLRVAQLGSVTISLSLRPCNHPGCQLHVVKVFFLVGWLVKALFNTLSLSPLAAEGRGTSVNWSTVAVFPTPTQLSH